MHKITNYKLAFGVFFLLSAVFILLSIYIVLNAPNLITAPTDQNTYLVEDLDEEVELYINQSEENERERPLGGEISLIHDLTPFHGENFTLVYNEDDTLFYLYINPKNIEEGNEEFDKFLRDNGIPKRRFFTGLIESRTPLSGNILTPEL